MSKPFAEQISEAWELARDSKVNAAIKNILVCGVGGSAIAGDILKDLVTEVPIIVNRDYNIPNFVNEETLAFVCSYSGNTEETRAAFEKVKAKTLNYFVLTSGGALAKEENVITLPTGFVPRAAIAYLFFPMLRVLQNSELIPEQDLDVVTAAVQESANADLSPLLSKLEKLPVIYGLPGYDALTYRWQTQFEENVKTLAHAHVFTELVHNEIEAFEAHAQQSSILFLRDPALDPRILKKADAALNLLAAYSTIELHGETRLAKTFYGIHYGDRLTGALAKQRGVDAVATPNIDRLKKSLSNE